MNTETTTTNGTVSSINMFLNREYPELVETGQVLVSSYHWRDGNTTLVSVVGSLEVIGSSHYYNETEAGPELEARLHRNLSDWKNE